MSGLSQTKSTYLTEINAQVSGLSLNVKSRDGYRPEDADLFLDGENIIISVGGLGYGGQGFITDMETNVKERITVSSELEPLQIVMKLGTTESNGLILPKLDVVSTKINIVPGTLMIDAKGDLPLYKTQPFEDGIKNWMTS